MILNFSCLLSPLAALPAEASERRFTYTYGSAVLPKGGMELEPWSTVGVGRDGFFLGFDHRLELEAGLTDRLQSAFYLKLSASTTAVGDQLVTETAWEGVSWEWKLKLADAVAAPVGLALYLEPEIGPAEGAVEAKVILDKRAGPFYVAFNPVFEQEWEFQTPDEVEHELVVEGDLGLAWFFSEAFSAGVEARERTLVPEGALESAAIFVGPVASYASKDGWWASITFLPQLPALARIDPAEPLELEHYERFATRLMLGFEL